MRVAAGRRLCDAAAIDVLADTPLTVLLERIGFRLAPGFSERVIFRELFPRGLTLLDLNTGRGRPAMNMSHVAARQEVRALLQAIGIAPPADQ